MHAQLFALQLKSIDHVHEHTLPPVSAEPALLNRPIL